MFGLPNVWNISKQKSRMSGWISMQNKLVTGRIFGLSDWMFWADVDVCCCMLYDVCCMLYNVCCMLYAVCCMLYVVCCMLYAVCCMLDVVCCMLYVVCCMLYVVCCMLYVVCCMWIFRRIEMSWYCMRLHVLWKLHVVLCISKSLFVGFYDVALFLSCCMMRSVLQ